MKKGYLILFSIIFCLMIIFPLPCLKTAGRQGSNPHKIDSENESFRVIFPDGSICEMSGKGLCVRSFGSRDVAERTRAGS